MHVAVLGAISLYSWFDNEHRLRRHFYDAPRRRQKQGARPPLAPQESQPPLS